jgi:hypothetical protein
MVDSTRVPLTAERLRELLNYDPATGVFTWKQRGRGRPVGRPAGGKNGRGYINIQIDEEQHQAHRLAWLHSFGHWPGSSLDHVNGDPADNRIANLREADPSQNACNKRGHGLSGIKGVSWCKQTQMWRASISKDGLDRTLGRFPSRAAAAAAYQSAARVLHGAFARVDAGPGQRAPNND